MSHYVLSFTIIAPSRRVLDNSAKLLNYLQLLGRDVHALGYFRFTPWHISVTFPANISILHTDRSHPNVLSEVLLFA